MRAALSNSSAIPLPAVGLNRVKYMILLYFQRLEEAANEDPQGELRAPSIAAIQSSNAQRNSGKL
jgi:hypothetical protein